MHSSDESTIPPPDLANEQDLTGLPLPPSSEQCIPRASQAREHHQSGSDTDPEAHEASPSGDDGRASEDCIPISKQKPHQVNASNAISSLLNSVASKNAKRNSQHTTMKMTPEKVKARTGRHRKSKDCTSKAIDEALQATMSDPTIFGSSPKEPMQTRVGGAARGPQFKGLQSHMHSGETGASTSKESEQKATGRPKRKGKHITPSQKAPKRRKLQTRTGGVKRRSVTKTTQSGSKSKKQKLPSVQDFLEGVSFAERARVQGLQDAYNQEETYSFSHVVSPLPPVKELFKCDQTVGNFKDLELAAKNPRRNQPPSFESFFSLAQTKTSGTSLTSKTDTHRPSEKSVFAAAEDWKLQNDKLTKEVLNLRAELVLVHNQAPATSLENAPSNSSEQSLKDSGLVVSARPGNMAILLSHLASQLSSAGIVQLPRSVLQGHLIHEDSKQYLNCAKRGFEFIRNQLRSTDCVNEKLTSSISFAFRNVLMKMVEHASKLSASDKGYGKSVFTELVSFLLLQIEEFYENLLAVESGVDVIWSTTVSQRIVKSFGNMLNALSSSSNEQLKKLLVRILQGIAKRIREGEEDPETLSIEGLCNSMEEAHRDEDLARLQVVE